MIRVLAAGDSSEAQMLVTAALGRSTPSGLIVEVSACELLKSHSQSHQIWVIINPLAIWTASIISLLEKASNKILLLGRLPEPLTDALELQNSGPVSSLNEAAKAKPADTFGESNSDARVVYLNPIGNQFSPLDVRHFQRYDFMDEWNNLGYGSITTEGSVWSLSSCHIAQLKNQIANVLTDGGTQATWSALWDSTGSVLWFARSVGPIDSQEWRLVESWLANYRCDELPCVPVIREIPAGYDSAVTMRLDCDEDVESARPLWETYCELEVPLSLALHATVLTDPKHHKLPLDVLGSGGSILSHTLTHAPNWGGSYEAALHEGAESRAVIERAIGHSVRYAVSPFHHTPEYARKALADAGYEGCVGGIINCDPDFMTARSGVPVGQGSGFIGFAQQCMLHGDCMQDSEDPIRIFKQAFSSAKQSAQFFGFLDHPFSERYQYGWESEVQRTEVHRSLIESMRKSGGNVLFASMEDAFDFLKAKASVAGVYENGQYQLSTPQIAPASWQIECEYRNERQVIGAGGCLL
ncbi:polysaccharide deacetylase [Ketobacter sp. MCCC 1A13808]|uniref:polysaccharide deacetylase n=1 Tax=Ketobacter sp. MCCC 1A13808 TaxID=2602738 RepID=UPI0012ECAFA0|nr:polysaccharide deacetylase [Ketobacter sp. MCCC 1A13808]MVF13760.1 polysaccharide deacetylase [Ketobacter sp. MCCC 1A13808]